MRNNKMDNFMILKIKLIVSVRNNEMINFIIPKNNFDSFVNVNKINNS